MVLELLARAARRVEPELRSWVERLPATSRLLSGYHLGWLDAEGRPTAGDTGKAVRPALAFACAEAVGGSAADAVEAAAAVELVHNFSLAHDDVIDRDTVRRHRPTLWKAFGTPAAILTGDALLSLACQAVAAGAGPQARLAVGRLTEAVQELVEGAGADVAFERRTDVTVSEYEAMAGKTGALIGAACALGALAGGADEARADHLQDFGRQLGLAFQIVDDLLGLFGDPRTTGKPVGADLMTRKKTYPILAALASGTADGRALATLYDEEFGPPLSPTHAIQATRLVQRAGGQTQAKEAIAVALRRASTSLAAADPTPAAAHDLTALATILTNRNR